ncbi:PEP-CTERM sorting domain-containing protein [Paucibacter sp. DJ2R-2]|uniref:PEP-CTERM sorting domain-containing protein n=1 Tax=Paucibacter sp. DJ2R-2 TaxID=2893558 RepID=UPI0021E392D0|nr:PEP-CTERM sorting domain-containing protein [Paucibacter sp. DJ2R-2]MCV2421091.1 PEP-CTERM sorting domain-containing protein [Paucibacter sp. DJ4R-1]MCV2439069.1 PEP-CTERM sorting domain-containing protein [Paucibacter sp. DJ2R-2]
MKKLILLSLLAAAGAHADVIYNNGPVVGGNGLSVLTSPASTFGFGMNAAAGISVADDFTVAAGSVWNVQSLDFFGYQTGSTGFTFSNATWSIISGDVNTGTVVASGTTAVTNGGLQGYRVTETTLTNTQRGIYKAQADVADFSLDAGTYWLRWSLTGSLASGPWQPPTSDAREGNAAQALAGAAFGTITETGSGLTVELPFAVNGTIAAAVPEPSSYLLMLAGGLAVAGVARRRRQAK